MNKRIEAIWEKKTKEGVALLDKVKLEYVKKIVEVLKEDPNLVNIVLEDLDLKEQEFIEKINDRNNTSIAFYNQVLSTTKEIKKEKYKEKTISH